VLLLTASAEEVDIAAAYRLGANAFLVKPSEANKMFDLVKAIRDFWLTCNVLPAESFRNRLAVAAPVHHTQPRSKRRFDGKLNVFGAGH
jgi:CheY-like chemotaxis protein